MTGPRPIQTTVLAACTNDYRSERNKWCVLPADQAPNVERWCFGYVKPEKPVVRKAAEGTAPPEGYTRMALSIILNDE